MKNRVLCFLLLGAMGIGLLGCTPSQSEAGSSSASLVTPGEKIVIEKSLSGNPIGGFDDKGNLTYGGDPSVLVDGDTVYLYVGHDISMNDSYVIPEYLCYSTKDLKSWNYEGVVLSMKDVTWADNNSAWAGQVAKHYDAEAKKDRYYLYFCSWDSTDGGKQSIGVAVSDSPTGPFTDIGTALVKGSFTEYETSGWNDIDPTVWIDQDEKGEEHIYLMWGNSKLYGCELNPDMISVKDLNGDGKIKFGIEVSEYATPQSFTEAPWLYRRQDENGKYYGDYYLFYAYGWREQMAYATADGSDFYNATWTYQGLLMPPTATSNTNHPAVFDFGGKTYFVYHNGSLPNGSGYRRVACIAELQFDANGKIAKIEETATGINGVISTIKGADAALSHQKFTNSTVDGSYPYKNIQVGSDFKNPATGDDWWEIVPGKADETNESYVSIESYNKAGLYLTVTEDQKIVLAQDYDGKQEKAQTFITVGGLNGSGVSFESVAFEGMYLTLKDGVATLTDGNDKDAATFSIETVEE